MQGGYKSERASAEPAGLRGRRSEVARRLQPRAGAGEHEQDERRGRDTPVRGSAPLPLPGDADRSGRCQRDFLPPPAPRALQQPIQPLHLRIQPAAQPGQAHGQTQVSRCSGSLPPGDRGCRATAEPCHEGSGLARGGEAGAETCPWKCSSGGAAALLWGLVPGPLGPAQSSRLNWV